MVKQFAENTENVRKKSLYYKMSADYTIIDCMSPDVLRKMVWLQAVQLLFTCRQWLTGRTTGKLSSVFICVFSSQWHNADAHASPQ